MTLDQKLEGTGTAIHRGYGYVIVLRQRWQPENKRKRRILHVQHSDLYLDPPSFPFSRFPCPQYLQESLGPEYLVASLLLATYFEKANRRLVTEPMSLIEDLSVTLVILNLGLGQGLRFGCHYL